MIRQLIETLLDLTAKLLVLAWMGDLFNNFVDDSVRSFFEHRSSARRTSLRIHFACFTNNMSHRTHSHWPFSGDEKTHGTFQFTQELFKFWCCCHHHLVLVPVPVLYLTCQWDTSFIYLKYQHTE